MDTPEDMLKKINSSKAALAKLATRVDKSKLELEGTRQKLGAMLEETKAQDVQSQRTHGVVKAIAYSIMLVGIYYASVSVNNSPVGNALTQLSCSAPVPWFDYIDRMLAALVVLVGTCVLAYDAHTRRLKVTAKVKKGI